MKIDLHSHTTHSDGLLSVSELLSRALSVKLDVLAITDHDTISGLTEAQQWLKAEQAPVKLIAGVEISTAWQEFEIHVVGLNINADCPQFQARLALQQQRRFERAEEIARRLAKANIADALPAVLALTNGGAITRTHFARFLVNSGHASSMNTVFKKYLARGKTGYVPNNWVAMAEAIQWIHDAGGQAVLAHPLKYKLNGKYLKRLVQDFALAGGDALEIISPQQTLVQRRELWALGQLHNLTASVGSDFHQPTAWNELGKHLYLPDDVTPIWADWALQPTATDTANLQGHAL
ncbi:PHP domain-containing protein [Alishewanella sp. SMS8]|uniref:RNase RNM n=1 Tax=Alishewanella sp. SMS8 TaxID=2994676 RepID=UPI002740E4C8|nr:PHP domain-containing protein [Alishewanella sp. SMS8]MDP5460094.1 PHP domain-containing protein [Alishewanella sp. SMS8]